MAGARKRTEWRRAVGAVAVLACAAAGAGCVETVKRGISMIGAQAGVSSPQSAAPSPTPRYYGSTAQLCGYATELRGSRLYWDVADASDGVREAQARGISLEDCALTLGRAAAGQDPTASTDSPTNPWGRTRAGTQSGLASDDPVPALSSAPSNPSDGALCRRATQTRQGRLYWAVGGANSEVRTAIMRGLTLERCAAILGREAAISDRTAQSDSPTQPWGDRSASASPEASSDRLCRQATRMEWGRLYWNIAEASDAVRQAQRAGLTLPECGRLLGRRAADPNPTASTDSPGHPWGLTDGALATMTDAGVCDAATEGSGESRSWDYSGAAMAVRAAKERNLSLSACRSILEPSSTRVATGPASNPTLGSDAEICRRATRWRDGELWWDPETDRAAYAESTKRRLGLRECRDLFGKAPETQVAETPSARLALGDDAEICRRATRWRDGSLWWDPKTDRAAYAESTRRRLGLSECRALLDEPAPRIARAEPEPPEPEQKPEPPPEPASAAAAAPESTTPVTAASDAEICRRATGRRGDTLLWDARTDRAAFNEATSRGLGLSECRRLAAEIVEEAPYAAPEASPEPQPAQKPEPPSPDSSSASSQFAQFSDRTLCAFATRRDRSGRMEWARSGTAAGAASVARERGLSVDACARLTGASQQPQTAVAPSPAPEPPPASTRAASGQFAQFPDRTLCAFATERRNNRFGWAETGTPANAAAAARRRGLSLQQCSSLLAPSGSAPQTAQTPSAPAPQSRAASTNMDDYEPTGTTGTGFAVSSRAIVTNAHVVEGCDAVFVRNEERAFITDDGWVDDDVDLAVMRVDEDLPSALEVRRGAAPLGERVAVIGFPYFGLLTSSAQITTGIISAGSGIGDDQSVFQISAPLQPGNSGGPVFGSDGSVVGVAVAVLDSEKVFEETGTRPQNIAFAVKADELKGFLDAAGERYSRRTRSVDRSVEEIFRRAEDATFLMACLRRK